MKHIEQTYKDKASAYIAAVRKAYPNDTQPHDLLTVDTMFRPGTVFQANKKSTVVDGAEVYMYLFTWQSPVFDGKYQSVHCMELPFVFDNIELARNMTGGGIQAHALADRVSRRHGFILPRPEIPITADYQNGQLIRLKTQQQCILI